MTSMGRRSRGRVWSRRPTRSSGLTVTSATVLPAPTGMGCCNASRAAASKGQTHMHF